MELFSNKPMKKNMLSLLAILTLAFWNSGCSQEKAAPAQPDWVPSANVYEVNLRQFSPEGNIAGFRQQIPRLKRLGVKVLWFMPIHPIGLKNRKGTLGSYYSVANYKAVNPEFGTLAEFKSMVDEIHQNDMKVLIDWVPRHTAWDNPWIKKHPEYYQKGKNGKITDPINPATGKSWGWTDVAALDYTNEGLHDAMIEAMLFWVNQTGIDGFRVDVAGEVPVEFWRKAIPALREANPEIFMLAESEEPWLRNEGLFNMTYGWSFHHLMKDIAQGKKGIDEIEKWYKADRAKFTQGFHMHFTQNHDENSWTGTEEELFGSAKNIMAVLACTYDGMPLVYNGQEAPLTKRLEFFEHDPIQWGNVERTGFYQALLGIHARQKALWAGEAGGEAVRIKTNHDDKIFAFKREKDDNRVIVILNMSNEELDVRIEDRSLDDVYRDVFMGMNLLIMENAQFHMTPWGYSIQVLVPKDMR